MKSSEVWQESRGCEQMMKSLGNNPTHSSSRPRLLIVGDLSRSTSGDLAVAAVERWGTEYETCVADVSGRIDQPALGSRLDAVLTAVGSHAFEMWCYTAHAVILLDDALSWRRRKTNQYVVSVGLRAVTRVGNTLTLFQAELETYSSVSEVIVDSGQQAAVSRLTAFGISVIVCDGTQPAELIQSIILPDPPSASWQNMPYVFVANHAADLRKDPDGLDRLALRLRQAGCSNVIVCAETAPDKEVPDPFTALLPLWPPDEAMTTIGLLRACACLVVSVGSWGQAFCEKYLTESQTGERSIARHCRIANHGLAALHFLESDLGSFVGQLLEGDPPISIPAYYRDRLTGVYEERNLAQIVVSVIVCTFNTEPELLYRSLRSALDTRHDALEVLLVDDGSEQRLDDWLAQRFPDDSGRRLKYLYCEKNQGLGLARNFGVRHATGEYVCFLDSDDALIPSAIPLLLAHAAAADVQCVVGKMVTTDSDLRPTGISLSSLWNLSCRIYYREAVDNLAVSAQMGQSKLIRRTAFEQYDLWFEAGYYEDARFSAILYSRLPEYHFVNMPFYLWARYEDRDTITKMCTPQHLRDKIAALDDAISLLAGDTRLHRIWLAFLNDLRPFLAGLRTVEPADQSECLSYISQFISRYCAELESLPTLTDRRLFKLIRNSDSDGLAKLLEQYGAAVSASTDNEPRDDYLVFTHYHLFVAIVLAISNLPRRSRFFIYTGYQVFDRELLETLAGLPFVESVVDYLESDIAATIDEGLESDPDSAEFTIPDVLFERFRTIFVGCSKADRVFIFNDKMPVWYFVSRYFTEIYRLEDGYKSFDREVKFADMTGHWGVITKWIPEQYPPINYRSDLIREIVLLTPPEANPEGLAPIRVIDFKKMADEAEAALSEIISKLYNLPDEHQCPPDAVLILTQALALNKLCSAAEQEQLYRTLIKGWGDRPVVIKPHPADTLTYQGWGVPVMDRNIPIEALNFSALHVAVAVTFSSSSIETIRFADRTVRLFDDVFDTKQDITDAIVNLSVEANWRSRFAALFGPEWQYSNTRAEADIGSEQVQYRGLLATLMSPRARARITDILMHPSRWLSVARRLRNAITRRLA